MPKVTIVADVELVKALVEDTRNWRMTFGLNDEGALTDMDLEDYHGA